MQRHREVVITGIGVLTPVGIGKEPFWQAMCEGRSGVQVVAEYASTKNPVRIGAPLTDFEPKQYVTPRKSIKVMSREVQTGVAAASLAMEDANLQRESVEAHRLGVIYGADFQYTNARDMIETYRAAMPEGTFHHELFGAGFVRNLQPLWLLKYLPNMAACHATIAFDARAAVNTHVLGGVSGLVAMIEAMHVIQRGGADAMIVGSSANRLDLTSKMFRSDANLSHRNESPLQASRPFDAQRDGMVNGEGAGALILEDRKHAEARGATIYATLQGGGSSYAPPAAKGGCSSCAVANSIRAALASSQVSPDQLGHVNANGLGTVEDDPQEAQAIADLLGEVPVTAPKSYFGNLGAASGIVETAVSLLALQNREVPASLNYEQPDPACPVKVIQGDPLRDAPSRAMVLNQSRTGQAAAVVLSSE